MRAARPRHRAWAGVGALIAFLAVAFVLPSPTQAGCSHPSDRPSIRLDEPIAKALIPANALIPDDFPVQPKPCSGPECSGNSSPAPSTSAPQPPPQVEWAIDPEISSGSRPNLTSPAALDDLDDQPIRTPSSVFHPPRRPR